MEVHGLKLAAPQQVPNLQTPAPVIPIQNTFEKLSAHPSGANLWEGRYWWHTSLKALFYYDGTKIMKVSATKA